MILSAVVVLTLVGAACTATQPVADAPVQLSSDEELNDFLRTLRRNLEQHDWQKIIELAESEHYRTQVREMKMGEPQYIAELFGLHRVDNDIKRGAILTWTDLERIRSVRFQSLDQAGNRMSLTGTVTLMNGEERALNATIIREGDAYRLTGGVG